MTMEIRYRCMQAIAAMTLALIFSDNPALAQDDDREPIRGLVKAKHEALIRSPLGSRLSQTPVQIGDAFETGSPLIVFTCHAEKADRAAAFAAYSGAKTEYKSIVEMHADGAAGKYEVALAKAKMNEAQARADAQSARADDCTIEAPFDGYVSKLFVNAHETPGGNEPLIKIVSSGTPEIHLIVPSHWSSKLAVNQQFRFFIEETGKEYSVKVLKIGAEVDAVSRTIPIIATFEASHRGVLPGMSGEARFFHLGG